MRENMSFNNGYTNYGNYGYNPNYYPYINPQQRLQSLEQQYPQYSQPILQQQMQQQVQPQIQPAQPQLQSQVQSQSQSQGNTQTQNLMAVKSEQQARDYPLDLTGAPQIFVMEDESKIFAKRFNVSNALPEFEIYEKVMHGIDADATLQTPDNSFLLSIVSDFSTKLEAMYTEIQELRKDVRYNNGDQFNISSTAFCEPKSTDESDNGICSGNGKHRTKSANDN